MKLNKLFDDLEVFPEGEADELSAIYQIDKSNYFIEVGCTTKRKRIFKLNTKVEDIIAKHREEILDYCLGKGNYPKDEPVHIRDIYMWDGDYFDIVCDRAEMEAMDYQLINLT